MYHAYIYRIKMFLIWIITVFFKSCFKWENVYEIKKNSNRMKVTRRLVKEVVNKMFYKIQFKLF